MNRFVDDEDVRLIRAAKNGDREAFTLLVRHYKRYVYRTAYGIVGHHMDTEDVAQEAFVRAYFSLSQLHDEHAFPSWIATISTRLALDVLKRRERNASFFKDPKLTTSIVQPDQTEGALQRMLLLNLMTKLSDEFRVVLVLRDIEGRSYQEISEILGIPQGTVKSRLHTARHQLRTWIQDSEREDGSHGMQ